MMLVRVSISFCQKAVKMNFDYCQNLSIATNRQFKSSGMGFAFPQVTKIKISYEYG